MGVQIGTTEARQEGFYWVFLGQNPPEIAYWERGEWWLAGDSKPWHPEDKGRPVSIDAAQIKQLRAELGPAAIAKRLGIARSSVYRALA